MKYQDRFKFNDDNDLISFEYEIEVGCVKPFDENTHYGGQILTDEETHTWVKKLRPTDCYTNESGMITIYDDMIVIEINRKD